MNTEWQQLCADLAAIPNTGEQRWHQLNRQQAARLLKDMRAYTPAGPQDLEQRDESPALSPQDPLPPDLPTTLGIFLDNETTEEGETLSPVQDFAGSVEETRQALFHTYAADPGPIGDDSGYVCPAHRWLPLVEAAAQTLMEAADHALREMPPSLKQEAKKARFVSDGWQSVAEGGAPEARRLMQVRQKRIPARP